MTNTTKAPKVTLNSILFAELPALRVLAEGETHTKDELTAHKTALAEAVQGIASNLAGYLINKVSADSVNVYGDILKATAKAIPSVLAEMEKERIEAEAKAQAQREADAAAAEEKRQQEEKEREAEKQRIIAILTKDGGMSLEVAEAMVAAQQKALGNTTKGEVKSYERVNVTVDGVQYEMPVKGNMSQELKDLVAKSGLERDAFIEKYKTPVAA